MSAETTEERHQREKDALEAEIEAMLAGAKSKNERKRMNQQAEKLRRELWQKQEEESVVDVEEKQKIPSKTEPETEKVSEADIKKQLNRERRMKIQQRKMREESELQESLKGVKTKGQLEMERLALQLKTLGLKMHPIMGDGHCLYRAVAYNFAAKGQSEFADFMVVRRVCAEEMRNNKEKYIEFSGCESDEEYLKHCDVVEKSADWGDELELIALTNAFKMSFIVHRDGHEPIKRGDYDSTTQLAFLEFYSTSGGHYNSVEPE